MDGGAQHNPRTVEEVFRDYKGRRAGMIKALTTDVEDFYQQCDPGKGKARLVFAGDLSLAMGATSGEGDIELTFETVKYSKVQAKDEDDGFDEEEDEHGDTLCGACGENYASDEFWICCDICERWFHGKCVKITPARAEHIKQYKCPSCSNKRPRP
nr:PHD finger protein ALFIN-LIKE 4-like [Ipomoea batatas]